ncbi:MAG TPA: heme-copper oxidase subunit III [Gaiellaceae bacterium]|nr:heme-copper oxidase subunit III [Gaiellaceae bacterium]
MTDYIAGGRKIADVPRTTAATGTPAVTRVIVRRTGPPAAWWGVVMLIASEGVLFAAFIGTFFYLRFNDPAWPPPHDPSPTVVLPLVMVAILSTSSGLMQLAWRAVRQGRLAATRLLLVVAVIVQSGYFAYEVHDFSDQLHTLPIGRDAYTSSHYVLLGADHAHVLIGIVFNLWLLWKLARGITTYRANAVQAITWYWHFVTLLTWAVTATVVSAALR